MTTLSFSLLIVEAVLVLFLFFRGSAFKLLVLSVLAGVISGQWELAGVMFDPTDVALLGLFLTLLTRKSSWLGQLFVRAPNRGIWLLLLILAGASYVTAPAHQDYLTDPVRVLYQLYRYSFRELLFLPLVVLLIPDQRRLAGLLAGFVVVADISVLLSIREGYQGFRSGGLFDANAVGSAYALPFLVCLAGLVLRERRLSRILLTCNLVLLTRGLLFSYSRGSFFAILAATIFFGGGLLYWRGSRSRALRLSFAGLLGLLALLIVKPDVASKPTIARLATITDPLAQDTFIWRVEERWPYFIGLIRERPWLGHGISVAEELGSRANTPHNGYLSVAVEEGLPFLAGMLLLGILAIRRAFVSFRSAPEAPTKLLSLTVIAAILGIMVHNIVESTFVVPFVIRSYWVCIALAHVLNQARLSHAVRPVDLFQAKMAAAGESAANPVG